MLHIVTRAEWGARYADGFQDSPLPFEEWWLHHSDTAAPADDLEEEAEAMRLLEKIGQERFGGGISYTYAIMPSGRVYQGHTIDRQGSHTKNRNDAARAIVLVGDYNKRRVTQEQVESAALLLAQCWERGYCARPYLDGGHQDAPGASTACPGNYAEAAVSVINQRAAELIGAVERQDDEGDDVAITEKDAELIAAKVWARSLGTSKGGGVELPEQTAKERLNALHRLNVLQKESDGVLRAQISALDPQKIAEAVPLEVAGAVVAALLARAHAAPPPAAPAQHAIRAADVEQEPVLESVPAAFVAADVAADESHVVPEPSLAAPHASFPWGASA